MTQIRPLTLGYCSRGSVRHPLWRSRNYALPTQNAQQRWRARTTTLRTSYRAGECLSPCVRIQGLIGQLWTITFYLHRSAAASMVPESKSKPSWILAGSDVRPECYGRSNTNLQPSQLGEHNRE